MITSPTQLSNCVIWLDGSDSTYFRQLSTGSTAVSNGDPVGYWQNLGSLSSVGHFTNLGGSSTTRPTYSSALSALTFDGSNDYLTLTATQNFTAETVFAVVSPISNNGFATARVYAQAANGVSDSGVGSYTPLVINSTTFVNNVFSFAGGSTNRSATTYRSYNTFDILTSYHSGTSLSNFRNGDSAAAHTNTLSLTVLRHRIGAGISNTGGLVTSSYLWGNVCEIIVYNRALTNFERADVEYYLTRKWSFLNSIPRRVYALRSGNWSDTNTWSVSGYGTTFGFPLSSDNVYTNTFTITADSSTRVGTIQNAAFAPNIAAGGSFWLANGVSLSANVTGGVNPYTLTTLPNVTATLYGNLVGSSTASTNTLSSYGNSNLTIVSNIRKQNVANSPVLTNNLTNGTLNIYGNINGWGANESFLNIGSGTVNVFGNIIANNDYSLYSTGRAITNSGANSVINVVGNVYGDTTLQQGAGSSIHNSATTTLNITGDVFSSTSANSPIFLNAGNLKVVGNVVVDRYYDTSIQSPNIFITGNCSASIYGFIQLISPEQNAIYSTSTSTLSVFSSVTNGTNGMQGIYSRFLDIIPNKSVQYIRNVTSNPQTLAKHYTVESFDYPSNNNVQSGVSYVNNLSTGTMIIPPASSVYLGVAVGDSYGTSNPLKVQDILSLEVSSLNSTNDIGSRFKNICTTATLTAITNSFKN